MQQLQRGASLLGTQLDETTGLANEGIGTAAGAPLRYASLA